MEPKVLSHDQTARTGDAEMPVRRLFIRRERALACFALPYHCVIGQGREEHLRRTENMDRGELMLSRENAVRNGETICLPLDREASTIFAAAYQEHGTLTTEELPIPAGADDLYFVIRTQFDGDRRLSLELAPAAH